MTKEEADKIAIIIGNAYGPAIEELCLMLNEADLGFVWAIRGEPPPHWQPSSLDGWLMTFAELEARDVVAVAAG